MLILNKSDINQLVNPSELMDVLTEALIQQEDGKITMPQRMHADFDGNMLLLMPCYSGDFFATKMVSVYPENPSKELPAIYGTVVLNDGNTGKPLAMIEGSSLTAQRTGAIGGIGIRHTTPENISTVGLIGAGVQGYHQLIYACSTRPVKSVRIFDHNTDTSKTIVAKLNRDFPNIEFSVAHSVEALLKHSQLIITATASSMPVLPDKPELLLGKHFIAVGSYTPEMQELPDKLFCLTDQLIVDTEHAAHESGDVINPVKAKQISIEQVIPISKLITGQVNLSANSTTIFKSVGMALFDLAAAKYFYRKALKNKVGKEVNFID
jgi:ornithine cyclodeaminase